MDIAWALIAVSSAPQSETLDHQRAWAERACHDKGWILARRFLGVASGKDGPRRLTRDLLLELRATPVAERPTWVLMIRLDRVGRGSIVESQIFVRDLFVLGARVYTRDAGEVRLDSAMDELIAAVQMAVSRHENEVRSDKMRSVYARRRAAGEIVSNRVPYGIVIGKERKYEAVPECVEAIRTAFRMRVEGMRVIDVARWLQQNAPPLRFKNGKSHVVHWTDDALAKVIANRIYSGLVVDEGTWLKAQRVARYSGKFPRRRKHGEFPLGGMLRCVCGRGLYASARVSRRRIVLGRKYVCRALWNHEGRYVNHDAFVCEQKFAEVLERASRDPEACMRMRWFGYHGDTLEILKAKQAELECKLAENDESRARVWRHEETGRISAGDVAERLSLLGDARKKLERRLVALMSERRMLECAAEEDANAERLFRTAYDQYQWGDIETKIVVARAIVIAFGGVRVSLDGGLLFGTGPDLTAQRRRKRSEII